MYGLCDCNNFYASCQRVFRPDLVGRPVVVLSNNDGCIIARSNEAKALGIGMGPPLYPVQGLIDRHGVAVFSANFALYGDMSRRVMATLRTLVPSVEVYSIDEAFFDLHGIAEPLDDYGRRIGRTIRRNTGIPVSIGIAPTKTLAKIASKLAKRYPKLDGCCYICLLYTSSNTEATDITTNTPMLNIPQELTAWKVSETATKSKLEADNAKQCYLEIACKIRQSGAYLLGLSLIHI